jgi:citrate lyase subunit beta/citryl-CoA lyase
MDMKQTLDFVAPLFVPGNRPERFQKAAASGADAIIIDLEDAVEPDAKVFARDALRADFANVPILVRVNSSGSIWHADDVAAVSALPFAGIVIPKAEASDAVWAICKQLERRRDIVALVETATGIADCVKIAETTAIGRIAFGSIDFCADVGCAHERDALLAARSALVLASRIAGKLAPLDGVTTSIDDDTLVERDARYACGLGFGGKLCIHPRQVRSAFAGFMPEASEIAWARTILTMGGGARAIGGHMVDEPVRIRARSILSRADRGSRHSAP